MRTPPLVPTTIKLRGHVVSGRGKATGDLAKFERELSEAAAQPLHPASVNIVLKRPIRFADSRAYIFDQGRRLLWPASANGIDVWLYRWRECPLHIIEVLSAVNLRERLGLRDGDKLTLTVDPRCLEPIGRAAHLAWTALWSGRKRLAYSSDAYYEKTMRASTHLGAAQQQPAVTGVAATVAFFAKYVIRQTLGLLRISPTRPASPEPVRHSFVRLEAESCADPGERQFRRIQNAVNYTKTSGSVYAATKFPAAYHTLYLNGRRVPGQRDPLRRLALLPVDFTGKSILDLGCNQGGMIHPLSAQVKWAVGIDYDPHMINAANLIRNSTGAHNTAFYVLDLQNEPLDLISDFLPEERADVCFLLSVCMWLKNWKDVIDFAQSHADSMIFESNGTQQQQEEQIAYLRTRYDSIGLLADSSEDDPTQKNRKLFHLTAPKRNTAHYLANSAPTGPQ